MIRQATASPAPSKSDRGEMEISRNTPESVRFLEPF